MTRIGVSGHRFLAEVEKVEQGIRLALERIEGSFPDEPLHVLSALADGADRLVVRQGLALPGALLTAVLPIPPDEYLADFETPDSRREFRDLLAMAKEVVELRGQATREVAYEAAGRYILGHSEVLLAVWDGASVHGQGGTADVVEGARRRGLPVAWVHAGNRQPGTNEPTTLGGEQGMVTFERLPDHDS